MFPGKAAPSAGVRYEVQEQAEAKYWISERRDVRKHAVSAIFQTANQWVDLCIAGNPLAAGCGGADQGQRLESPSR